ANALQTHTIFVGGNLVVNGNFASSGAFTTGITLNGTGAQTITVGGGAAPPTGAFTINKASGTATLASDLPVNYSGQTLTITSGTLDLAGHNLTVNSALTVSAAGTLQLQGAETITASSVTLDAGSTVRYNGTAGSYTLKDYAYSNLTIDGGAATVFSITNPLTVAGAFTLSSGAFSQGAQTMNVAGNFALANGTTFTKATGGQALTLDGTGTLSDSNGTLQDLGALTIAGAG